MGCKCKAAKYAQDVRRNYGVKPTPQSPLSKEIEKKVNKKFKLDGQGILILLLFPLLITFVVIPVVFYGLYKTFTSKEPKIDIYKFLRKKKNVQQQ